MSDQGVKSISGATGQFVALRSDVGQQGGTFAPESGKYVPPQPATETNFEALAERLNATAQSIGTDLRFKIDLEKGSSVIQVLDRVTGEIIRVIPPEKAKLSLSVSGDVQLALYDQVV